MTLDELRALCEAAARDLASRPTRPLPVAVVLPHHDATRVIVLDGFPDADEARHHALSVFAAHEMVPQGVPCFGFIAEATLGGEDVLLLAYGARRRGAFVTAAHFGPEGLGDFAASEELDPTAMPFLKPLRHAADTAPAPTGGSVLPG